jgi:NlpC/P60 family putative phage cell wall peptidase
MAPDPMGPTPASVVAEARRWIGTPFRHASSARGLGCDCLGLVLGIRRALWPHDAWDAPPYAADWAEAARSERLAEACGRRLSPAGAEPGPGVIVLFRWREGRPASHLAIASSAAAIIHAHARLAVCEVPLGPAWRRRIAACYRFPEMT